MRKLLWVLGSLITLMAHAAFAQVTTIPVRGGEHADFTRIVVQIPEANHWRVTSDDRWARVDVTGPPLRFDLRQTFSKIPRTRLRDARAGPDWLELDLACDCEIRASEEIRGFLVIDLVGRPSLARPASRATVRPRERPESIRASSAVSALAAAQAGRDLARLVREGTAGSATERSLTLTTLFGPNAEPTVLPSTNPADMGSSERAAIREELSRALAGSVAEGILNGAEAFDPGSGPPVPEAANPTADLGAHIRFSTPSGVTEPAGLGSTRRDDARCRLAETIDMNLWNLDKSGASETELWNALLGEFDRLDQNAAIALAQHYLARGFGAEARMLLGMLPVETEETRLLTHLGHLVDLEGRPPLPELKILQDCNAFAHLWAFLDSPRDTPAQDTQSDLLYQALSMMPRQLRLHIGPEISQRLLLQGERDAAQTIRALLDRVAVDATPALELARAKLDLPQSTPTQAARIEARLSPERSDETLLFLLVKRAQQGALLEEDLRTYAQDRLLALRNTPEGRRIAGLLINALLRAEEFSSAVDLFEQQKPHLASETAATMTDLLAGLAELADDTSFVTSVFRLAPWQAEGLAVGTTETIAKRLQALGFEPQAELLRTAHTAAMQQPGDERAQSIPAQNGGDAMRASGREATSDTDRTQAASATVDMLPNSGASAPEQSGVINHASEDGAGQIENVQAGPDDAPSSTPQNADIAREITGMPLNGSGLARPLPDREPGDAVTSAAATEPDTETEAIIPPHGLLSQSRDALSESAALRARISALLDQEADTP